MTTRRTGKDATPPPPPLTSVDLAAILQKIDERHNELISILASEVKPSITSLEAKIDNFQIQLSDHGQRLNALEENVTTYNDIVDELQARCTTLEETCVKLKAQVVDISSRERRNNIRLINLSESIESKAEDGPTQFFAELLAEVLGPSVLPRVPKLDRAHRALRPKPAPGAKPRAVIARVHNYRVKEAIIREARRKRGQLFYKGKPVLIFEDYPPEVMDERSKYRDVMSELYKQGLKPALLYPSRLFITTKKGDRRHLASPKDALDFLKKIQREDSQVEENMDTHSEGSPRAGEVGGSPRTSDESGR